MELRRLQKVHDRSVARLWLISCVQVARLRKCDQLRTRDCIRDQFAVAEWQKPVRLAVDHERGQLDLAKPAISFPPKDTCQLRRISLRFRERSSPDCEIFVDPSARGV